MTTIENEYTPDYYFAALKLLEQLYLDGQIPEYMFQNMLTEYADVVDISAFIRGNPNSNRKERSL